MSLSLDYTSTKDVRPTSNIFGEKTVRPHFIGHLDNFELKDTIDLFLKILYIRVDVKSGLSCSVFFYSIELSFINAEVKSAIKLVQKLNQGCWGLNRGGAVIFSELKPVPLYDC